MTDERMAEVLQAHADSIEARPSEQLLQRTVEKEMLIPALRHGARALLGSVPVAEGEASPPSAQERSATDQLVNSVREPPPETVEHALGQLEATFELMRLADTDTEERLNALRSDYRKRIAALIAAVRQSDRSLETRFAELISTELDHYAQKIAKRVLEGIR